MSENRVLVTGATGYIGGRLIPRLVANGFSVRAVGRSLDKLACRPWAREPHVELAAADALDRDAMIAAARGCRWAFYLIHSMNSGKKKFAEADRRSAENMAAAADIAGIERIIYLGGLGDHRHAALSKHLRSRHEVEGILQRSSAKVTNLRAAMILGSGSASFEMLRYLVERLPVMTPPRWVNTPCQPIAVSDVLGYLIGCLQNDATAGQTFDIGGPDVLTYRSLIDIYAEEAGLPRRWVIPVPVLTPALSALWIHLVTPVPASIARPLAEGLSIPVTCSDTRIHELVPRSPLSCRQAIRIALDRTRQNLVETCCYDAGLSAPPEWSTCGDAEYAGGTILQCGYRATIRTTPDRVWRAVHRIGGEKGWYYADALWKIRGLMDRAAGGPGMRRGRKNPTVLQPGEALDFWRVLQVKPPYRLTLLAEMKVPGEALLDFRIRSLGTDRTELEMVSRFVPGGLFGILYWYLFYPFHEVIFFGMMRRMAAAVGASMVDPPHRFTPRTEAACAIPDLE